MFYSNRVSQVKLDNTGIPMKRRRQRQGFSLVELIVVIVIIGLLAGMVTVSVRSYLIRGKQAVASMEIAKICQALDTFYSVSDRYPSVDEGLGALAAETDMFPEGLLKRLPDDPWKNDYLYRIPGSQSSYEVICLGADGLEGGEGAERDISSDTLDSQ